MPGPRCARRHASARGAAPPLSTSHDCSLRATVHSSAREKGPASERRPPSLPGESPLLHVAPLPAMRARQATMGAGRRSA
eukprot:11841064-Alexandrium_andersonii.AAC.1